jgi:hypothetical protein
MLGGRGGKGIDVLDAERSGWFYALFFVDVVKYDLQKLHKKYVITSKKTMFGTVL